MQELTQIFLRLKKEYNEKIKLRDWDSALDILSKMIALKPSAKLYLKRGKMFLKLDKLDLAQENFEQACLIDPRSEEARAWKEQTDVVQEKAPTIFLDNKNQEEEDLTVYADDISLSEKTTLVREKAKTASSSIFPNKEFGRYQIIEEIGRGGMGKVYRVYDPQLERVVALKVLLSEGDASLESTQRFLREAKATAQLDHPNIISLHDIGIHQERHFFTMDLIEGKALKDILKENSLSYSQLAEMMIKISEATEYAHQKGIIHRDLKPANIMVDMAGEPKVMDFGLAKVVNANDDISRTGQQMGTPVYMSPEQADGGKIDFRTDVYALAATLYQGITGRAPFQGENYFNILFQVLQVDPILPRELNPDIPIELEAICLKGLEKNPEKRYAQAKLFSQDLQNFLDHRPIEAKPATILTQAQKFFRRHLALTLTVTAIFVTILLGASISFWQWGIAQEAEKKAQEKATLLAQEKEEKNQNFEEAAVNLAQISLAKALEAYDKKNWAQSGAFAGRALEFLEPLDNSKFSAIKEKAQELIEVCLKRNRKLWQSNTYVHSIFDISVKEQEDILAVASEEGVGIYDRGSGQVIQSIKTDTKGAIALDIHPTKPWLAIARYEQVMIWDYQEKHWRNNLFGHSKNIKCLTFSPQGNLIASGSDDKTIRIWNSQTGETIKVFKGHQHWVVSLLFFNDGKNLLSVSWDQTAKIWDIETGNIVHSWGVPLPLIEGPSLEVVEEKNSDTTFSQNDNLEKNKEASLEVFLDEEKENTEEKESISLEKEIDSFSSEYGGTEGSFISIGDFKKIMTCDLAAKKQHLLAFTSGGKEVIIWNKNSQKEETRFSCDQLITALCFSEDGNFLFVGDIDNQIKVWDWKKKVQTWKTSPLFAYPKKLFLLQDRKALLVAANGLSVWNMEKKKALILPIPDKSEPDLVASPDGFWGVSFRGMEKGVSLWNFENKQKSILFPEKDFFFQASFLSNQWLVLSNHKEILVHEMKTGKFIRHYSYPNSNSFVVLACHPYEKSIVFRDSDNLLKLWNPFTNELSEVYRPIYRVMEIAFSPDGEFLVFRTEDSRILFFSWKKKQIVQEQQFDGLQAFSFQPKGSLIAFVTETEVIIWNSKERKMEEILDRDQNSQLIWKFSPDGKKLAFLKEGSIHIWDTQNKKETEQFGSDIDSFAWALNGKMLVSKPISGNGISFWNSSPTWEQTEIAPATKILDIGSIAFSQKHNLLAYALWDQQVALKHTENKNAYYWENREFLSKDKISSLAFSPQENFLAIGTKEGEVCLWDIENKKMIFSSFDKKKKAQERIQKLVFSSPGNLLASLSQGSNLSLWKLPEGKLVHSPTNFTSIIDLAYHPTKDIIALVKQQEIIFFHWKEQKIENVFSLSGESPSAISFNSRGDFLAVGFQDGKIKIWNTSTSLWQKTLDKHKDTVTKIQFSANDEMIFSSSYDKSIVIWDSKTGIPKQTLWHKKPVISFSLGQGQSLFSLTQEGYEEWNPKSGGSIPHKVQYTLYAATQFSPDGSKLATGGFKGEVFLREGKKYQKTRILSHHQNQVHQVAFSSDGNFLASASLNDSIYLWDLKKDQKHLFETEKDSLSRLLFWENNFLYTSGDNLVVWNLKEKKKKYQLDKILSFALEPKENTLTIIKKNKDIVFWNLEERRWIPKKSPFFHSWSNLENIRYAPNKDAVILQKNSFSGGIYYLNNGHLVPFDLPIQATIFHARKNRFIIAQEAEVQWGSYLLKRLIEKDFRNGKSEFFDEGQSVSIDFHPSKESFVYAKWNGEVLLFKERKNDHPVVKNQLYHWGTKLLSQPQSTNPSHFDYRWDIPGEIIEEGLKKIPADTTEILFETSIRKDLAIETYHFPSPLWDAFPGE